jgi:hypothetical protein
VAVQPDAGLAGLRARRLRLLLAVLGDRDYVYPFMRMTMDHDRQFGGGALEDRGPH